MATKTRRALSDEIGELCDQARCSDKVSAIHHAQFVDRNWNPHPPRSFIKWWPHGKAVCEEKSGAAWRHIDEVRAYNCETVRQIWTEAVSQFEVDAGYARKTKPDSRGKPGC